MYEINRGCACRTSFACLALFLAYILFHALCSNLETSRKYAPESFSFPPISHFSNYSTDARLGHRHVLAEEAADGEASGDLSSLSLVSTCMRLIDLDLYTNASNTHTSLTRGIFFHSILFIIGFGRLGRGVVLLACSCPSWGRGPGLDGECLD